MNQECPQLRLGAFFAQSKRKERLIITVKEANIALSDEIYSELAESRACYERGEYEDFDTALDDIGKKYGL